ncbi:conserved exported hypothetical protein [Desulfosarcina cetonica]|uniref:hypothetical protein n=1 Tax=Desulfosarcina cetonica TaxID=90730 RepID=UPI0006D0E370|nr:hypothetical protein [Desulfosarcina cetonica]VTR68126.1 conserved exported hypothetical protein [Desulfosarcina cetonica]
MNTKINIWSTLAIALAATFILFGTSYAGNYTDNADIRGIVTSNSQLVDNHGKAFNIANSGEGLDVQTLIGKKVEVRGTVMDKGGQPTIEVHNYKIHPWSSLNPDNR